MQKFEAQRAFKASDENHLLPETAGAYTSETFNQWVYDPVQKLGLNIWFASGKNGGDKPFPEFMVTVIAFLDGETYFSKTEGHGNHAGGIAAGNAFLTMVEPFKQWRIDYLGLLQKIAGPQADDDSVKGDKPLLSRMDLTVNIQSPPIEQGTQGDRGEIASSGTTPRTALRYEQLCRIQGTVQIGSREIDVDAYGMRSHRCNSASIYDSGAVGHTWATALFPSGRGFHLLSYQIEPKAEVGFLYGHYFDGTDYHEAEVLRFPYYTGEEGTEQARLVMLLDGKPLEIELESYTPLVNLAPTGYRLTRAAARFVMDGEVGGGVLERSLFKQYPAGGEYLDARAAATA